MPIILEDDQHEDDVNDTVDETLLVRPDGTPTPEAEIIADFLEDVDWNDVLDDADVVPFVERTDLFLIPVSEEEDASLLALTPEELVEYNAVNGTKYGPEHGKLYRGAYYRKIGHTDEDTSEPVYELVVEDEGGVTYNDEDGVMVVEGDVIDGDIVAEMVDEEDLYEMFIEHLNTELNPDLLEDRAIYAAFADLIDEDQLDEKKSPFKRGQFRKGPFKSAKPGGSGNAGKLHNVRARMIMAMLKKGAIKRVAKGSGYKGGDYQYDSPKGKGKPSMMKVWRKVRGKSYQKVSKIKKLVDPARAKVVATIYKNLGSKMPKPYVPSERRLARRRKSSAKAIKKDRAKGETGPATRAAQARAKGVLKKAGQGIKNAMAKMKKKAATKKGAAKKQAAGKAAALFKGKGKKKKATVESFRDNPVALVAEAVNTRPAFNNLTEQKSSTK